MTHRNPFAAVPQQPSLQTDGGGSPGAGSGSGAVGGGASAASASGAGVTGNGGGAASPVSLSDDTPVTVGGKTYGSYREYRESNYVPRSEYDQVKNLTKAEIERNLRTIAQQMQRQGQQSGQQPPRVDPLAGVRDLPIVDGKTLASLYEQGLGPLAQAIQKLQNDNQALAKHVQQLRGGVGSLAQKNGSVEFEKRLDTAIGQLGEGVDLKDPFIRELAQDVFHSYEWATGKEDQEFQKYLGDRYREAEKHFKAKFKSQLEAAKNRRWVKPGGGATTPSGPARNPLARASSSDIAQHLFRPAVNA